MKNTYNIVKKPLISEKSFQAAAKGQYSFVVDRTATKMQIKNAIEKLFTVDVVKVTTANTTKKRNILTRTTRRTKDTLVKKARVHLKKGQKIDIFEEEST